MFETIGLVLMFGAVGALVIAGVIYCFVKVLMGGVDE